MDVGDVYIADLGAERRTHVLVLSTRRFHQLAERVVVAPAWHGPLVDPPMPWTVTADDLTFAVDLLLTLPTARLLEPVGRAPHAAVVAARRALLAIT